LCLLVARQRRFYADCVDVPATAFDHRRRLGAVVIRGGA
jgi:hypothetical protein